MKGSSKCNQNKFLEYHDVLKSPYLPPTKWQKIINAAYACVHAFVTFGLNLHVWYREVCMATKIAQC